MTQAFFEGDQSGHGAAQLAADWRRLGNVHRSGVADVAKLVAPHGFVVTEEITPAELDARYLEPLPGPRVKPRGPMRIACYSACDEAPRVSVSWQATAHGPPRRRSGR